MSLSYDVKVLSPASGAVRGAPFTDFPRYGFETYEIALMNQACFFVASCSDNSRKEVFQPHLPVRLPCYDLTPVI